MASHIPGIINICACVAIYEICVYIYVYMYVLIYVYMVYDMTSTRSGQNGCCNNFMPDCRCILRQELAVMNEKQILRMTNSPFIVRLAATFNGGASLF